MCGRTDSNPPMITCPESSAHEATSANGSYVDLMVTAVDSVDPHPIITCTPASGSLFDIQDTPVSCTAADASGNVSGICAFDVTVAGALLTFWQA